MDKALIIGKDNEVLNTLIPLHCETDEPTILDCTYNKGVMWRGTDYKPVRMDIDGTLDVDFVADFKNMPFKNESFDIIVFDPPHLPTAGASENSSKIYEKRYGITADCKEREGENVSKLFLPFLEEAKRVLKPGGIVLAKIADLIHNNKFQWQHVDFINSVKDVGMTPCDLMIKSDPRAGTLMSSKWKNVKHLRKNYCYWIVVRNSDKCVVKRNREE
jgi:SAM-dependent methyltransferase